MRHNPEFSPFTPEFSYPVDVTLDPAVKNNTATAIIDPGRKYWFIIEGFMAVSSTAGRWMTDVKDSAGSSYNNRPIENALLYGSVGSTGQILPYWLPSKLVVSPSTKLQLELTGIGAKQDIQIMAFGYKHGDLARPPRTGLVYRTETRIVDKKPQAVEVQASEFRQSPYWLVFEYLIPAAGDLGMDEQAAPEGQPLFLTERQAIFSNTATGGFEAQFEIPTQATWDAGFVRRDNGYGNAQGPFLLPKVRYVKGGRVVQGNVRDLSLAINQTGQIVYGGYRRFYSGPDA